MNTELSYFPGMGDFARFPSTLRGFALRLTIAILTLSAVPARAAEVYKILDAEGHVVYTDHADSDAPKTAVRLNAQSANQAQRAATLQAAHKAEDLQRKKQQAVAAVKRARYAHDAGVQCDEAQKNFYALKAAGAPDAAAAVKREDARQAMILACTD